MSATGTVRSVVRVARNRDLTFMAAGVAHYALASLVPLLILVLALGTYLGGQAVVDTLVRRAGTFLSSSGQTFLQRALEDSAGRAGVGLVSLLVTLWSGLKIFRGLDVAFAEVYGERGSPSLLTQVRDGLVVLGLIVLALASMVAMGVIVAYVSLPFGHQTLVGTVVLLLTLGVVFLPFYYVLPPVSVSVREVLPGTVVSALGWILLQVGFLYYAQHADKYAAYGFLGAILLFITWLYLGAIVMLVGAVVNAVLGNRTAA